MHVNADGSQSSVVHPGSAYSWRIFLQTLDVLKGILEVPVLVSNAVAKIESFRTVLLPDHRRTLRRVENYAVDWVPLVEVMALVVRLATVVVQGELAVRVPGIPPQVHELNWILVREWPPWLHNEIDGPFWPYESGVIVCAKEHWNTIQRVRVTDQRKQDRLIKRVSLSQ